MLDLNSYERAVTTKVLLEAWSVTEPGDKREERAREGVALIVANHAHELPEVMSLLWELQKLIDAQAAGAGARVKFEDLADRLDDTLLAELFLKALGFGPVHNGWLRSGSSTVDIDLSGYLKTNVVPIRAVK